MEIKNVIKGLEFGHKERCKNEGHKERLEAERTVEEGRKQEKHK